MNSMEAQNAFHGILQIKDYLGPGEWLVLGCQGDQVVSRARIVGHLSMGAALREKGRHTHSPDLRSMVSLLHLDVATGLNFRITWQPLPSTMWGSAEKPCSCPMKRQHVTDLVAIQLLQYT